MKGKIEVGSVCVIVQDGKVDEKLVGLECTVIGGLDRRKTKLGSGEIVEMDCYVITMQGHGSEKFNAKPNQLRLKKFPPATDAWLQEKINNLLNKVPDNILKEETV